MKNSILKFIREMIPVMLGVYLGFALNTFGENRKEAKQTESYKTMLVNEIKQNQKSIEGGIEYHLQLSEDFKRIRDSENIKKDFEEYTLRGLRAGFVSESAFKTGTQTGLIQNFDLGLVQSLNRLYTLQNKYTNFNEGILNSVLSQKFPETISEIKSLVTIMSMNMNDINHFEAELLEFYTGILHDMEK